MSKIEKIAVAGLLTFTLGAGVAVSQVRQLDAHEHGVSSLKIAVEGNNAVFELVSPGSDIVGFEHAPENDAQKKQIKDALAVLEQPLALFSAPQAAQCSVKNVHAEFETEEHEEEKHDDHKDEHKHADDKDEHKHDDHEDGDHKDEHKHEDDKDDHKHAEHKDEHKHSEKEESGHAEFHTKWELSCKNMAALTELETSFFDKFSNAKELEVEAFTDLGQMAKEVEKGTEIIKLAP